MFVSKTIIENGVYFPAERKAFVPDHQHGRHELRCKTVIFIWKDKGPEKVVKGRKSPQSWIVYILKTEIYCFGMDRQNRSFSKCVFMAPTRQEYRTNNRVRKRITR